MAETEQNTSHDCLIRVFGLSTGENAPRTLYAR
jgi:hypothetical protein